MPPKRLKTAAASRLVGYARVSTDEQGTDPQLDELHVAGCATILEEHASGADRSRPVLARLFREIRAGETLMVVRLDRLARSVSHLLAVIDFSLRKSRDYHAWVGFGGPKGPCPVFVCPDLNAARTRSRVGGNPGLQAGDFGAALGGARSHTPADGRLTNSRPACRDLEHDGTPPSVKRGDGWTGGPPHRMASSGRSRSTARGHNASDAS
jgi:hypothetical protein